MAGNLDEWTRDWCAVNYYASSPSRNPEGPADDASSCHSRGTRGGMYTGAPYFLRCARRSQCDPSYAWNTNGFRCVVESK